MQGIFSTRLVLLNKIVNNGWVTFDNGVIRAVGEGVRPAGVEWVDGAGLLLSPGFIDTHVHGGNGADFLDGTPEAFETIANYHLSQGTTALCPTLATATYDHIKAVTAVWETARSRVKGRLLGLHLEGPHLTASKAGAQDPALLINAEEEHISWLVENAPRVSQMTVAPELVNALNLIERGAKAGIKFSAGHSEARERELQPAIERGLSKVTHLFNAMTYAAKNGIFREAGLAEYALVEDRLYCELVADGVHVSPTLMKLAYRTKGAGRIALVSDALAGTGLPVGTEFMLGKLRCRVAEGYCSLASGAALAGSATRIRDQVRIMAQSVGAPLADAFRMGTHTPAKMMGVDDRLGSIAEGKAADFVQMDENFEVHHVWVAGKRVHSNQAA